MASRRIYITLNDAKEKDRIIENYLSQSYSESDAIKEAIYRLATNSIQQIHNNPNSTEKVQLTPKDNKKVKKDIERLGNKKVQKGADSIEKVEKIPNTNNELNDTNGNDKVQMDDDIGIDLSQFDDKPVEIIKQDDDKEDLKQKKLKSLKQFM